MPKIVLPKDSTGLLAEVDIARDTIETLVNQIQYLLQGRIDKNNLVKDGDDYALISADTVQDMASTVRPIGGVKLIASKSADTDNFNDSVFEPMVEKMREMPTYQVVTAKKTMSFSNDDDAGTKDYPARFTLTIPKSDELRLVYGDKWFNRHSEYENTNINRILTIPAVHFNVYCDSNETEFAWRWRILDIAEDFDSITIDFSIVLDQTDFGDGDYMILDIEAFALCERVL